MEYDDLSTNPAVFPRDKLGRVTQKVETLRMGNGQNETRVTRYGYDNRGRLSWACEQGVYKRAYLYDANSNRTRARVCDPATCDASCTELSFKAGTHDVQDRIMTYGDPPPSRCQPTDGKRDWDPGLRGAG